MHHTAAYWIEQLHLTPLPEEGGMYRENFRSADVLQPAGLPARYTGPRSAMTDIFYLLAGDMFSAFHRLASDELWHFHTGDTLLVHVIEPAGTYTCHRMGFQIDAGETLRVTMPAGCWFAAELAERKPDRFALVSCVVAPGFEFADFELGSRAALCAQFSAHREAVTRLTRS